MTRLRIEIIEKSKADGGEKDDPVGALFGGDRYRLVLAHGRFLEGQGFELSGDRMVAVPTRLEPVGDSITYQLAWTIAETDPAPVAR